jgi:YD repeat-containing protein
MIVGTVAAASNVVRIDYDAAGNIVAIERVQAAPIALTGSKSPTGAIVIKGTAASTGELGSIDTLGKAIAQVDAPYGAASAATSQLVAR